MERDPGCPIISGTLSTARYQVNLLVDNAQTRAAPLVFEDNPSHPNLVGRVDHISQMGTLVTNFTLIKPGAHIGQVNGLALIHLDDFAFGLGALQPRSFITARDVGEVTVEQICFPEMSPRSGQRARSARMAQDSHYLVARVLRLRSGPVWYNKQAKICPCPNPRPCHVQAGGSEDP
jgi:hypothetical protein